MATERQIAANRRNAGKSTGPRSRAGKRRARQNAYRHGLAAGPSSSATFTRNVEKLARKIAGSSKDPIILEHARDAAYAAFDVARIRRVKLALIERACAPRALATPRLFNSVREAKRFLDFVVKGKTLPTPDPVDLSTMMLTDAEAVRRALPELVKLDRYESRAARRRDKAIQRTIKDGGF
jgi:hypothetical protein